MAFDLLKGARLDDVYTLARYLLGSAADDAVQECYLRASCITLSIPRHFRMAELFAQRSVREALSPDG